MTYHEQRIWHEAAPPLDIQVSPSVAQQKATVFLAEYVTMMAEGGIPTLAVDSSPIWQIPIVLNIPEIGVVGTVGRLKIDALTGRIEMLTETKITQIQGLCHAMASYYTSSATAIS